MSKKLRFGIMGTLRGSSFARCLQFMADAELVAVCENVTANLSHVEPYLTPEVKVFEDFDEFLHCGLDAVVLCNYFDEHAKYAIKCFEAGVAVLSETTAAPTLGECVQLVEACEKYNGRYMLAANCPYFKAVHAMKMRIDKGETGDIFYGEAEYIHGERKLVNGYADRPEDNLHWRQFLPANMYNMHTLGPLMYATNTMPKTVSCTMICNDRISKAKGHIKDSVGAVVVTQMDNGAVFQTTGCSGYAPTSKWYRLACENYTMETERYDWREERLIVAHDADYIEHLLPSEEAAGLAAKAIKSGDVAAAGHGGIDYYTTYHFIKYLQGKEVPFFDVYRSVALSAVAILGWYSALLDSKQMTIPDFRDKAQRDAVRNDFRKPFARSVKELTMPCRMDQKDQFTL